MPRLQKIANSGTDTIVDGIETVGIVVKVGKYGAEGLCAKVKGWRDETVADVEDGSEARTMERATNNAKRLEAAKLDLADFEANRKA